MLAKLVYWTAIGFSQKEFSFASIRSYHLSYHPEVEYFTSMEAVTNILFIGERSGEGVRRGKTAYSRQSSDNMHVIRDLLLIPSAKCLVLFY